MCRDADVDARQKNRQKEGDVFEPADESGVERAVGIVVYGLEIFDKQVRHVNRRRRAVDQNADPALMQLAAERIGPLRQTDAFEN